MRIARIAAVFILAAASLSFSTTVSAATLQVGTVTMSPTSFNFGSVPVGASGTATFQLQNDTQSDLTITSVAITPAGSESYALLNACGPDLQGVGICDIYVTFDPVSVGRKNYTLVVVTSAGTFSAPLAGVGIPSSMVFSPASLAFGNGVVGVSSTKSATLTNTGTSSVSISSIKVASSSESYAQTNNCPVSLDGGASCTINVTYDPVSAGVKNYAIAVVDEVGTQNLLLTGTATASPISLSPSSIAFGTVNVGVPASTSVAVKNISSSPVTFSGIGVTPVGTQSYTQTNNCPTTIAGGATCTIKITFDPVSPGTKNYAISLADNVGTQEVRLTGTAVASPMTFDVSQLLFGTQPIGYKTTQSTFFQNTSPSSVTISSINITPAGSRSYSTSNNCPTTLVADNGCQISVSFDPVSTGNKNYSLTVVDSAGTQSIPVQGMGNLASLPNLAYGPETVINSGGDKPSYVVTADFNGDGKLDFAVADEISKTIFVFLNNGDGTFAKPVATTVQSGAFTINMMLVGDFNNDKKPDLLVSVIAGSQADYVLLGKGDGTFTQLAAVPGSFGFLSGAVADLNGDGKLDYVAGENGTLSYHLGNGDGTFQPAVSIPNLNFSFHGLALGDFNGDKKLDIAVVYPSDSGIGTLAILFGNGDGTFQSPITQEVDDNEVEGLQVADFNGDGKLDLLFDYDGFAEIGYGDGAGHFSVGGNGSGASLVYFDGILNIGNYAKSQVADFDGDGKPDVIVGGYTWGNLDIVLNPGIGTFPYRLNTSMTLPLIPDIDAIAVGDFNGDKVPDIVTVNETNGEATVFLSKKPQ